MHNCVLCGKESCVYDVRDFCKECLKNCQEDISSKRVPPELANFITVTELVGRFSPIELARTKLAKKRMDTAVENKKIRARLEVIGSKPYVSQTKEEQEFFKEHQDLFWTSAEETGELTVEEATDDFYRIINNLTKDSPF